MEADVADAVAALDKSVKQIRAQLEPLLETPLDTLLPSLTTKDRVRLQVAVAFAINTLFHAFLRTQGESLVDHPVQKELVRRYSRRRFWQ